MYDCSVQRAFLSHKFTGKERDSESGLDNFGARYNSSSMGRFMSPDTPFVDQHAENPQSWNLYTYVRNNPLANIDPDGECTKDSQGNFHGDDCQQGTGTGDKPDQVHVQSTPLPRTWSQVLGLDGAYNKAQYDRDWQFHQWVRDTGGTEVRAELPIGPKDIEALYNLVKLLKPSGAKMSQIIARLGKGFGNPEIAMKELAALRSTAAVAGQSATGFYIHADVTIYRVGSDYLTVAADGRVLSFVQNATSGEGVALRYIQLGGR